jgi:hypothetical protein
MCACVRHGVDGCTACSSAPVAVCSLSGLAKHVHGVFGLHIGCPVNACSIVLSCTCSPQPDAFTLSLSLSALQPRFLSKKEREALALEKLQVQRSNAAAAGSGGGAASNGAGLPPPPPLPPRGDRGDVDGRGAGR